MLFPVVDPYDVARPAANAANAVNASVMVSPEAQAFVVQMCQAWEDWRAALGPGASTGGGGGGNHTDHTSVFVGLVVFFWVVFLNLKM